MFWHCELDNPAYISDVGYVKVGDSNSRIVDMAVQDGSLIVLKDGNQDASSIFVHTPTLDYDLGRVYPSSQSVISEGCVGGARSFRDDLVYMSARGVEGITSPTVTNSERSLKHRSTLIGQRACGREPIQRTDGRMERLLLRAVWRHDVSCGQPGHVQRKRQL